MARFQFTIGGRAIVVAIGATLLAGPALGQYVDSRMQKEVERGASIQSEVEAELRRQEELLRSIDQDKATEEALNAEAAKEVNLLERADTRIAPKAPTERSRLLPLFESPETIEIPAGTPRWNNNKKLRVTRSVLDVTRDGLPEQVRYVDADTSQLVFTESDRDYDGVIDQWRSYVGGVIVRQEIDTDGDGKVDQWEHYARGRMTERAIDRDADGHKDAFYKFSGDSLVEESHDHNNDGKPDLIVSYRDRHQVKKQEDRSKDGSIDTWVSFGVLGNAELPIRIERDTNASGKVDIIESFDIATGKPIIAKREEDKDGDGVPDIISVYKDGKLNRREITNPDVVDF